MKKNQGIAWSILLLLALSACLIGCSAKSDDGNSSAAGNDDDKNKTELASDAKAGDAAKTKDGKKEEKTEEAVPVEVAALTRGEIESVLRFSSTLEAENEVQVVSQAKRLVTELLVEEGDHVLRGQPLIRLQDDEQRSALAKVKGQLAKAEREYAQQERLFRQELISEQEFNDATYELEQLQLDLADAERELSYTVVTAPISGTITNRLVNLGDQVQIEQHLFDLVDFDSIVARIYVPEKYLDDLSTGLPARISAATAENGHTGTVKRIAPVVDPKSGTVKVTVDVGHQRRLRPGMYVDVDLVTSTHTDAILLPKRAVIYDNDQMFVYRLRDENRVERVFVEPAVSDKYFIKPVRGVAEGDRIVVAGQAGLKDGALVSLPGEDEERKSGGAQLASTAG